MELNNQFAEIRGLIISAKQKAYQAVNKELINLYWQIGEYVYNKVNNQEWGNSIVKNLSEYIRRNEPDIKGFSAQNIWRMKQFYETYHDNEKLSPLVREISWSNNLLILSKTNTEIEKEFYLRLSIAEKLKKKELERPSVGIILCKYGDTKIVEYALSRSLSPALVAKYQTELIETKILEQKLDEFYQLNENNQEP